MAKNQPKTLCDLCDQPVEISGFNLMTDKEIKHFCCTGCLSIYSLLTEYSITTETITNKTNNEDNDL